MATTASNRTVPTAALIVDSTYIGIPWSAIIAGAVGAAALAFVLHSFAAGLGLSVSSASPTWRDASFALILVSGLYLLLVALASYSFGAYIAARLQPPLVDVGDRAEFRDGMNGLLVWALATLLTGMIAIAGLQVAPRLAAPSGGSGAATSVAGENIIAYDLDKLFRAPERPQGAADNMQYRRSEAARILLTTAGHEGMSSDDRTYLVRLVSGVTGLDQAAAQQRVDAVAEQAEENIGRARRAGVILGFMLGAAALVGAAAAWFAGIAAGRHRDGHEALDRWWDWGSPASR